MWLQQRVTLSCDTPNSALQWYVSYEIRVKKHTVCRDAPNRTGETLLETYFFVYVPFDKFKKQFYRTQRMFFLFFSGLVEYLYDLQLASWKGKVYGEILQDMEINPVRQDENFFDKLPLTWHHSII